MLTGPELGAAIAKAIELKKCSKAAFARAMGVQPPSVTDWINYGRLDKKHLDALVAYFSDVAGLDFWGLDFGSQPMRQQHGLGNDVKLSSQASEVVDLIYALDGAGERSQKIFTHISGLLLLYRDNLSEQDQREVKKDPRSSVREAVKFSGIKDHGKHRPGTKRD
jgi:hypothetical protein